MRAYFSLLQVIASAILHHLMDKMHTLWHAATQSCPQQFGSVVEILSPTIFQVHPSLIPKQSRPQGEEGMPLYTHACGSMPQYSSVPGQLGEKSVSAAWASGENLNDFVPAFLCV